MKAATGYYSLLQYCPDRSRLEGVNIGVILFVPEYKYLGTRTTTSNDRINRFWGRKNVDADHINSLKCFIQDRLEVQGVASFEEFQRFVRTRANDLLLLEPRPLSVTDPERELECLFSRLVGGRRKPQPAKRLFPDLDREFRTRLKDRMRFDVPVVVPVVNSTLHIPYMYRNGECKLVKPHAFGAKGIDIGLRLAAEGDLINKHHVEGERRSLIILPKLEIGIPNPDRIRASLTGLFRDFKIRTVWPEDQQAFISQVEREACVS